METIAMTGAALLLGAVCSAAADTAAPGAGTLALPTPEQVAWQDMELGAFIHFAPNTWQDQEYDDRSTPLREINPAKLDTDQWVEAATACGARFAIITASHETGFRLWQSDVNPYSLKAVRWGNGHRDLVGEFVESCRKAGIEPGIYIPEKKLGVRIEDDILVTETGYEVLTSNAPKEIEEIEALMRENSRRFRQASR